MIAIKTAKEIEIMREGGRIAAQVLAGVLRCVKAGVRTLDLDNFAEKMILEGGASASFKGFKGYLFSTCINVNEGVVHGLPGRRRIRNGDLVTVDLGIYYKGYHTDTAKTVVVGKQKPKGAEKFLRTGRQALNEAIGQCRVGNHVGDVSCAIQKAVEGAGFTVIRDLVGHGIGRELHEEPQIPCFGRPGRGPKLKAGMVLAIEVIYTVGDPSLELEKDGWTMRTKDGSLAGLLEHTVAVANSNPIVLTQV